LNIIFPLFLYPYQYFIGYKINLRHSFSLLQAKIFFNSLFFVEILMQISDNSIVESAAATRQE